MTYNRHDKNHCTQHRVEFDRLYNIVFDEIKEIARNTVDTGEVAESLAEAYDNERKAQQELLEKNIAKARNRIDILERMTTKAYEDLLSETINEAMFNSVIERTKAETEELQKQIADYEVCLSKNGSEDGNARKWIDLIKDYSDITELDSDTLNRLIRRIVVHENITKDGERDISLEIHYNFRPMDESKTYNLSDYTDANPIAKAV